MATSIYWTGTRMTSKPGLQPSVSPSTRVKSKVRCLLLSVSLIQFSPGLFVSEHNISGDVLCMLSPEELKDIGVVTIGQRLAILKAVYQLKLAHNIPIDADHYVPPCMSRL